jgi:hypothetical protein
MNSGAVIVALRNAQMDYMALAAWSAGNIRRHLDLPVAVITDDTQADTSMFDRVIVVETPQDAGFRNLDNTQPAIWQNTNRVDAFDLSPWGRTLLLDADYVVASADLRVIVDSAAAISTHRWAYDVTGGNDLSGLNWFGTSRMPQWWATVMVFDRSDRSRMVFDCMRMIRDNWPHYERIYGVSKGLYRNDQALSIALNIENGHTLETTDIPWRLATVMPECDIRVMAQDQYHISYQDGQGRDRYIVTKGQDLHVMAKKALEVIVANTS